MKSFLDGLKRLFCTKAEMLGIETEEVSVSDGAMPPGIYINTCIHGPGYGSADRLINPAQDREKLHKAGITFIEVK